MSICVLDVVNVGGWSIYTEAGQWTYDDSFSVKCTDG